MEKLEKNTLDLPLLSPEKVEEYKSPSVWQLELRFKKLSYLALHLDPYTGAPEDQTLKNLVQEFNLEDAMKNPFDFTNHLLKLIDQTESEIKSLRQ